MKRLLGTLAIALIAASATAKAEILNIDLTAGSSTAISSTGTWASSFNYNLDPLLAGKPNLLNSYGFGANHNFVATALASQSSITPSPALGRFNVGLGVCYNFSAPSCDQNSNGTGDDIAMGGSPKQKEVDGATGAQNEGIALSFGGAPSNFVFELLSLTFDRIDADGSDDALLKYIDENGQAQSVALNSCTTTQCKVDVNVKGRNFEIWAMEDDDDWTLRSAQLGIGAQQVPEPATLALFGIGALGMAALRRRRAA